MSGSRKPIGVAVWLVELASRILLLELEIAGNSAREKLTERMASGPSLQSSPVRELDSRELG